MKKVLLLSCFLAGAAALSAQNLTVVETLKAANGHELQIVKDNDGRLFRRLLKDGKATASAQSQTRADANTEEPTFYEGFEGWQSSYGLNWIPDGWTKKNTPENTPTEEQLSHNVNNSWYVYQSSNLYQELTTDGKNEAFIHFAYKGDYCTAAAQDEWLITPAIALGKSETLHFMLQADFFNVYDCTNFDWSALTYPSPRTVVCNMSVMVSEDNGESWTKAWDLATNVADKMTDKECYDKSDLKISHYDVDLSAYNNKTVKLAFRYTRAEGDWMGNSMILDGVTIDHKATAGVDNIAVSETSEQRPEYYRLDGVRVDTENPQPGLYLRKQGEKVEKVVIR